MKIKIKIEIPDDGAEALVIRGGIRIEFNGRVGVTVHTNGNVNVRAAVNDPLGRVIAPEIGEPMGDGTIFAGVSPDTGTPMYTTIAAAPLLMMWKEAMQYTADLDANGHKDWTLPSKTELNVLYQNHQKGALRGTFNEGYGASYWSSTEYNTISAWNQYITSGNQNTDLKTNGYWVRCVRR